MTADFDTDRPVPKLVVPEIRDYQRINAELVTLLDEGHPRVILTGVEDQRLLLSTLRGSWNAIVEVIGQAGPELAAGLDAPGLKLICRGNALDGVGSGLLAGTVLVCGSAGAAAGYAMRGGLIIVRGEAGPRAGSSQSGGILILEGPVGRLAGERQSGGYLFAEASHLGPYAGFGRRGGKLAARGSAIAIAADDVAVYSAALARIAEMD